MIDIALKEWAVVCDLLLEGGQTILLRKGGIHETAGPGKFEIEHRRFLLFPSWLHQKPAALKPALRDRVTIFGQEPAEFSFRGLGEVGGVWRVKDRVSFDQLDDLHGYAPAQIDMRFAYKPENPLYLVAVRAYRLRQPVTVKNGPEYGGCRSWVPLAPSDAVDDAGAVPVLEAAAFAGIVARINKALD